MGDETTGLDAAAARHLLRRTGFGASPRDVAFFTGLTRGEAADRLLAVPAKGFMPSGPDFETAVLKWIKYMLKTRTPLQEKLVLFWHDHFATGFSKVQNVRLMAAQNRTLRLGCLGDMRVLVKAINKDAAMIEWLDTVRNHKDVPNENYARELQELFTLGVLDLRGNPNYTQTDVEQIARAFTGWTYDRANGAVSFDAADHDTVAEFPGRGSGTKMIYASTGAFATTPRFASGDRRTPRRYAAIGRSAARDLREVAKIIYGVKRGVPGVTARFFELAIGGFDTHANQGGAEPDGLHADLLRGVGDSVQVFCDDLTDMGVIDRVLVLVWSEFGRRIPQNDSGTDHGSQGPVMFVGGSVIGGVYGNHPDILNLDVNENTAYSQSAGPHRSTDLRDVYGTVLKHWLDMPSANIASGVLTLDVGDPVTTWTTANFALGSSRSVGRMARHAPWGVSGALVRSTVSAVASSAGRKKQCSNAPRAVRPAQ